MVLLAGLATAVCGAALVAQGTPVRPTAASAPSTTPARAQTAPVAATRPATPKPATSHPVTATTGLTAAEQTALVKQYCADLPQRTRQGRRPVAGRVRRRASVDRARRRLREDDPQAARRHDAAGRRAAARAGGARRRWPPRSRPGSIAPPRSTRIPARRPFQRLNRAEYAARGARPAGPRRRRHRLPAARHHQRRLRQRRRRRRRFSPTLMEGYLRAASQISRLAVGDRQRQRRPSATYKVPRTASQMRHVEGAPFGTRGGISVVAHLPGRRRLRRSR